MYRTSDNLRKHNFIACKFSCDDGVTWLFVVYVDTDYELIWGISSLVNQYILFTVLQTTNEFLSTSIQHCVFVTQERKFIHWNREVGTHLASIHLLCTHGTRNAMNYRLLNSEYLQCTFLFPADTQIIIATNFSMAQTLYQQLRMD